MAFGVQQGNRNRRHLDPGSPAGGQRLNLFVDRPAFHRQQRCTRLVQRLSQFQNLIQGGQREEVEGVIGRIVDATPTPT